MSSCRFGAWLVLAFCLIGLAVPGLTQAGRDPDNCMWNLRFENVLTNVENKPAHLDLYASRKDGRFVSAIATSRLFNVAAHQADVSGLVYKDGTLSGTVVFSVNADAWVPEDGKPLPVVATLKDVKVDLKDPNRDGAISGTYTGRSQDLNRAGNVRGRMEDDSGIPLTDCSMVVALNNAWVGGRDGSARRMALGISIRGGKVHAMSFGGVQMSTNVPEADIELQPNQYTMTVNGAQFEGTVAVPYLRMDVEEGDPTATYTFALKGCRVNNLAAGTFTVTVTQDGKPPIVQTGSFKGGIGQPWAVNTDTRPWWVPVKDFTPVQPGEHPRLLFRKGDIPALRKRAETPEGKAIIQRLRVLLNGKDGLTMPALYNAAAAAYAGGGLRPDDDGDAAPKDGAGGVYTMSHMAGYGLLYQLTGDVQYAEMGKQCFEKALAGVRDADDRYSWKNPGGFLRAGPSLAWYAIGYDLCYDGWDPEYRQKVASLIQGYQQEMGISLLTMSVQSRQGPSSNHFGPQVGGATLAWLAIMGDPGTDAKLTAKMLDSAESCVKRSMANGWSDHGFFPEGDGPGCISSNTIYTTALQALRIARGRDYVNTEHSNARWMTMKWVMATVQPLQYPPIRGGYMHNVWNRTGLSGGGTYCQGFGVLNDADKAALLWHYNRLYKESDDKIGVPCDTIAPHPGRAVLAFVNWPIGTPEANPATVLPKAVRDARWGEWMIRNRWQDRNDILVFTRGNIHIQGLGEQTMFPQTLKGQVTGFQELPEGAAVTSADSAFGANFSDASGAVGVLVMVNGEPARDYRAYGSKSKVQTFTLAGKPVTVMTLASGAQPIVQVVGDRIAIGRLTIGYEGGKVVFGKTAG